MKRIVCFADSSAVADTVEQVLHGHDLHMLSASRLSADVRTAVQRLAPDVILLELNRAMDNAHLYYFLRTDHATRATPVILVSPTESAAHHAAILDADDVLSRAALADRLHQTVTRLMPQLHSAAA